ncbi:hypothetical protein [Allobranchiibius sp. CTAmp26]|uniref:hypothetical protein n=1 Tax=Allobranchiibius sp. CTAmp26 TaxID=2815214 RepID=UPI001AA16160|nr:hypothetical protein [Allobranchiibius sp. CTAmp26]MBO1756502.1 hypothetical protein [Allobranchiibius sp. CTAmp26]
MNIKLYLNESDEPGEWSPITPPQNSDHNDPRAWVLQQFKVDVMGPLPLTDLPSQLRPSAGRGTATVGHIAGGGRVVIVSEDEPTP